jgi:hypothetical protein
MCGFKEAEISNLTSFLTSFANGFVEAGAADFAALTGLSTTFTTGFVGTGAAGFATLTGLSTTFTVGFATVIGLSATFTTGFVGAGAVGLLETGAGVGLVVFLANSPFVINRFVDGSKTILLKSGLKIIQGLLLILFYLYIKFLFFLET